MDKDIRDSSFCPNYHSIIIVLEAVKDFNAANKRLLLNREWNIRIGIHTGRVVAGVIGKK